MVRLINFAMLVMVLSLPLYGARTYVEKRRPPARSAAEHQLDIARLSILPRDEYLVSGQGAPRSEYAECNRELPFFQKSLASKGLTAIETITCAPVVGDTDTYAPSFRALASERLETSLVLGGRYNSLSFCEIEGQRIMTEHSKRGTLVLEASCKHLRGPASSPDGRNSEELFQPAVVLLVKAAKPDPAARERSLEALVTGEKVSPAAGE